MLSVPSVVHFEGRASGPSIEVVGEHLAASRSLFTRSQSQASKFVLVQIRLQETSPVAASKPSHILCPKNGAKQPSVSTLHLEARIATTSSPPAPQASGDAFPGSSNSHGYMAFKHPRFLRLNPGRSKQE